MADTDNGKQNPIMSEAWSKLILNVGVPSAISLFLVWFLTLGLTGDIKVMKETLAQQAPNLSQIANDQKQVRALLQQICANTAATNKERGLCFQF